MHGLDDNFVRAIQEDKAGNIWISTNDGISRWNSKNNYSKTIIITMAYRQVTL